MKHNSMKEWPTLATSFTSRDVRTMRARMRDFRLGCQLLERTETLHAADMLMAKNLHSAPCRIELVTMPSSAFKEIDIIPVVQTTQVRYGLHDVPTGSIAWLVQEQPRIDACVTDSIEHLLLMHRPLLGARFVLHRVKQGVKKWQWILSKLPHSDTDIIGINGRGYGYLCAR